MNNKKQVAIIGGGAAGFFAAINCAETHPDYSITILEKSPNLLSKVKISGGGRCNVTHACFDPKLLVKNYPRGEKQLLGPFTRFNPTNTIQWFEKRGAELKAEADGRMFPVTDNSQTIINCFLTEARRLGITIQHYAGVEDIAPQPNQQLQLRLSGGQYLLFDAVIITTGSSSGMWQLLKNLGHTIVQPVPSLFTFNIKSEIIKGLEGLSVTNATIKVSNSKLSATGPLLITHWGISGPAVLRLSAWGARILAEMKYEFQVEINWCGMELTEVKEHLLNYKQNNPRKNILAHALFGLPRRLWERLAAPYNYNYADLSNKNMELLLQALTKTTLAVTGRSAFKDEFVTAGGVDVNEVDFKTMQSKKIPGIYFAGEVLDIDAITGGFNFQAAWTTGCIAGMCA